MLLAQSDGLAGKIAWGADIAGQIAQVACAIDAGTDGCATLHGGFQRFFASRLSARDANQLGADRLALLAFSLIVFVAFALCFLGESLTQPASRFAFDLYAGQGKVGASGVRFKDSLKPSAEHLGGVLAIQFLVFAATEQQQTFTFQTHWIVDDLCLAQFSGEIF